jgi:hypothetical protein
VTKNNITASDLQEILIKIDQRKRNKVRGDNRIISEAKKDCNVIYNKKLFQIIFFVRY